MPGLDRRNLLKLFGASAMLEACDVIRVDVEVKPGPADADGMLPITPNEYFYVYEQGEQPEPYEVEDWSMEIRVDGEVVAVLAYDFFLQHTPIEVEYTLQCIGGNPRNTLINNAVWGGLPLEEILAELEVDIPAASIELVMEGADRAGVVGRYASSVPIADVLGGRVWLVWEMNGEPVNFDHGAPCRFIVQGRYGTKNVKWPVFIDLSSTPFRGYWENLNWSNDATYRVNGFILNPSDGTSAAPGVLIYGTAYAGSKPVERVQITFDDGATWEDTEIYYSPGPNRWSLWRTSYDGPTGRVHARIRVQTSEGSVTQGPEGSDQALGYDGGMEVRFRVGV